MRLRLIDWNRSASATAEAAHREYFPEKWGITRIVGEPNVIALFSNNPYALFPTLQDEEREELIRRLAQEGFKTLGSGYYPEPDVGDRYTYAVLIQAKKQDLDQLDGIQRQVIDWALKEACERKLPNVDALLPTI